MKDEVALIDSNILVYAYDIAYNKKRKKCSELIGLPFEGKRTLAVSVQNLSEFYVISTQKIQNPIKKEEAIAVINNFLNISDWVILKIDGKSVYEALNITLEYKVSYWDALIAAVMKQNSIYKIYTQDTDFKKIPWLEVIDPLK